MQAFNIHRAMFRSMLRKTCIRSHLFLLPVSLLRLQADKSYEKQQFRHLQRCKVPGRGEGKRTLLFLSW